MIPLFHPPKQNVDRMIAELRDTLSGRWWGQGPKVDLFEGMFGDKFGFPYPVMVNSGTAALHVAYKLADIQPGDEVIVPVLTCTATCHPLLHMGAKIVFADVLPDTLTLDPADVENKITPQTKAIVTVHLGGAVRNMKRLASICKEYGMRRKIFLIEDAAQALGASFVGRHSDITCFSFQAIKHMSTGDGGMICVKTKSMRARAKRLRWFDIDREQKIRKGWQAWDRRGITFDQCEPGFKYQPTDIDASIGIAALADFDKNLVHRGTLVNTYRSELLGMKCVTLLNRDANDADWLFMVLVNANRDTFAAFLRDRGIETNVAHVRNDVFTVFGGKRLPLPGMSEIESKYLCLPLNDAIGLEDVAHVCNAITDFEGTIDG